MVLDPTELITSPVNAGNAVAEIVPVKSFNVMVTTPVWPLTDVTPPNGFNISSQLASELAGSAFNI